MKVVFFNRFFYPHTSATSQILSDLAFHLAAQGHDVHVVTSRLPTEDSEDVAFGVKVHRVGQSDRPERGLLNKAIAYFAFYRAARNAARQYITGGDVVVAKTDPPMLANAIAPIAKRRGARLVVWIQDLFPEIAQAFGILVFRGPIGALLRRYRNSSLASAVQVVTIGDVMAQRLKSTCGISSRVIRVIHNWADGASISPLEHNNNPLRTEWHLVHKFVIGYSGNLGRVHEFETLLGAAELLRNADDIRFLIIGSGARLEEVTRTIEHLGLSNVRVQPHQPRALLAQSLCVPDVHLCVLKPEFEGLVHPSKLYGIMAAGRPVVHIGAEDGETAALVKAAECGFVIPTGDAKGLAKLVSTLAQQPALCKAMGESGRREFLRRFDKSIAVAKWEGLLIEVSHQERCY